MQDPISETEGGNTFSGPLHTAGDVFAFGLIECGVFVPLTLTTVCNLTGCYAYTSPHIVRHDSLVVVHFTRKSIYKFLGITIGKITSL